MRINRTLPFCLLVVLLTASPSWAGVLVLPANQVLGDSLWHHPEYSFADDTLFAIDTVWQMSKDTAFRVGLTDAGDHPTWVITGVSILAKSKTHYPKAKCWLLPYVNDVRLDPLIVPNFKLGTTEITCSFDITQLDTLLPDSTWNWDDINNLSVRYQPRTSGVIYYVNYIYAMVTYIDTSSASIGHHFEFAPIASPETLGVPFPVSISALDMGGNLLTGYNQDAYLTDFTGTVMPNLVTFSGGQCNTMVTISDVTAGTAITVSDGDTSATSNSFEVIDPGLHHFAFAPISSPQTQNTPFSIGIAACGFFGDTVTSFTGQVGLWDLTGNLSPDSTGSFTAGVWSGQVTVASAIGLDSILCEYTSTKGYFTGASNGFEVKAQTGTTGGSIQIPLPIKSFGARVSPNPVRGRADIEFQLPKEGRITASVFNILGQEVMARDFGTVPAGIKTISWQLEKTVKPGVYFFTFSLNGNVMVVRKVSAVR